MSNVQVLLSTCHRHVSQPAFFLDVRGVAKRTRMRKQTIFQPDDKDKRELEAFGRVSSHQSNRHFGLVLISVRNQGRMIDEVSQTLGSLLVIVERRVNQ